MLQKLRSAKGQGMTEYIIIVALIAIAAIGVVSLFGDNIRGLFSASANGLAGMESTDPKTSKADAKHYNHKNLKSFGTGNAGRD